MISISVESYCQECKMFGPKVSKSADGDVIVTCEHEDRCRYLRELFKVTERKEYPVKNTGKGITYEIR